MPNEEDGEQPSPGTPEHAYLQGPPPQQLQDQSQQPMNMANGQSMDSLLAGSIMGPPPLPPSITAQGY